MKKGRYGGPAMILVNARLSKLPKAEKGDNPMKLQVVLLLTLTTVLTLPLTADAQGMPQVRSHSPGSAPHTRKTVSLMYACSICHHQVSAAMAKELHYICPVDHGKLIPVKTTLPARLK